MASRPTELLPPLREEGQATRTECGPWDNHNPHRPWPGKSLEGEPKMRDGDSFQGRLGRQAAPQVGRVGTCLAPNEPLEQPLQEAARVHRQLAPKSERPDDEPWQGLYLRAAGWVETCLQGPGHLRQKASRGGAEMAKGENHPQTHTTHIPPPGTVLL